MTQALYSTQFEMGGDTGCYNGSPNVRNNCINFFKNYVEHLKVIKKCEGNALANGCQPEFNQNTYSIGNCNVYTKNYVDNINNSYVLADGQILNITMAWQTNIFMVDINGKKGPNKGGYDVFQFWIYKDATKNSLYFSDYITGNCVRRDDTKGLTYFHDLDKW